MNIILIRSEISNECVRGYLYADGLCLATLEPPWKFNLRNISCIPAAEYKLSYLSKSASGKYREVYHVQSVESRGGILIHKGNVVKHTRGCILIGLRWGHLGGSRAVLNSASAMEQLRNKVGTEDSSLHIFGNQYV